MALEFIDVFACSAICIRMTKMTEIAAATNVMTIRLRFSVFSGHCLQALPSPVPGLKPARHVEQRMFASLRRKPSRELQDSSLSVIASGNFFISKFFAPRHADGCRHSVNCKLLLFVRQNPNLAFTLTSVVSLPSQLAPSGHILQAHARGSCSRLTARYSSGAQSPADVHFLLGTLHSVAGRRSPRTLA